MKIVLPIIRTNLVSNSLVFLFCPFLETKKENNKTFFKELKCKDESNLLNSINLTGLCRLKNMPSICGCSKKLFNWQTVRESLMYKYSTPVLYEWTISFGFG